MTRKLRLAIDYYAPWYHPLEAGYPEADYELDVEPAFYAYFYALQAEVAAFNKTLEAMIALAEDMHHRPDVTKGEP